jgi:2-phospho-L-lactate guanylyltransferase
LTPVLIPVSRRSEAKQRLSTVLAPAERAAIASALLYDVLAAVREAGFPIWIVTADENLLQNGLGDGINIIEEPHDASGLNGALSYARERLAAVGESSILIIPADLPLLDAAELAGFVRDCEEHCPVGIVPAPDNGTNALFLSPPSVIKLRFGLSSAENHAEEARHAGLEPCLRQLRSFQTDLDTPADLRLFLERESDTETYRVACRLELPERLRDLQPNAGGVRA